MIFPRLPFPELVGSRQVAGARIRRSQVHLGDHSVRFVHRSLEIPAQAIVEGQPPADLPVVLSVQAERLDVAPVGLCK